MVVLGCFLFEAFRLCGLVVFDFVAVVGCWFVTLGLLFVWMICCGVLMGVAVRFVVIVLIGGCGLLVLGLV